MSNKYPFIDNTLEDFVVWLSENIIVFGFPNKVSAQGYVDSLPKESINAVS
jgi:hypothetical protein